MKCVVALLDFGIGGKKKTGRIPYGVDSTLLRGGIKTLDFS